MQSTVSMNDFPNVEYEVRELFELPVPAWPTDQIEANADPYEILFYARRNEFQFLYLALRSILQEEIAKFDTYRQSIKTQLEKGSYTPESADIDAGMLAAKIRSVNETANLTKLARRLATTTLLQHQDLEGVIVDYHDAYPIEMMRAVVLRTLGSSESGPDALLFE